MKTLIFTLITLSFSLSYAGRIDHYYREVAKTGKIHRPHRMGIIKTLRIKLGLEQRSFHKAIRQGDLARVKDFLDRQEIDPNAPSPFSNEPPLYDAAMGGNKEMVELLLTHPEINPNIKDTSGYTILQLYSIASPVGFNMKIAKALLNHHKTDPNIKDEGGHSALHIASSQGRSDMVELLLTHPKTDPNIKNKEGFAVIHIAAIMNDLRSIKALLRHPDIKVNALGGEFRITALEAALSGGHKEVAEAIKEYQNQMKEKPSHTLTKEVS